MGVIYYYSDYLTLENNGTEYILVDGQKLYVKKEKFDISDFFLYYSYILLLISLIGREHLIIIMAILIMGSIFMIVSLHKLYHTPLDKLFAIEKEEPSCPSYKVYTKKGIFLFMIFLKKSFGSELYIHLKYCYL